MRTHLLRAIIALIPACITTPAHAQDAAKIVDQYIKAEGGSKVLTKINTLTLEGSFANNANEKVGTYTVITKQSRAAGMNADGRTVGVSSPQRRIDGHDTADDDVIRNDCIARCHREEVDTVPADPTGARALDAAQQVEQRRLARARRSADCGLRAG